MNNTFLHKIFNIGIDKNSSIKENKKTKLLNIFCFTWAIMIVVITLFDILFQREIIESLKIHGVSYILIVYIFYLQKHKLYTLARVIFLTSIIGVTFVFANYTTPFSLIENFYFIYPLIAIILIDKKWINISILILCFLLYFVPNFYFQHYPKDTILPVLILSVFGASYVILNYSENLNKKHEKEILASKKELEQAYLKLEESKKSEIAKVQLKALKTQMNPHFMFNAINSIQNLILTNQKEEAYTYLTKFSLFIRETINTSENSFIRFENELSILYKYLELEKLRFGEDFEYEVLNFVEDNRIEIPSAIIQPFIEEAIRYRLLHKTNGKKKLQIRFDIDNNLICTIIDNGVSTAASEEIIEKNKDENKNAMTEAIKKRLSLLKDHHKTDVKMNYYNTEGETTVVIQIPFINVDF